MPVGFVVRCRSRPESASQTGGKRRLVWRAMLFGPTFSAIDDPTVKLTDPRWWATLAPKRLSQGAAIMGIHPALSVQETDAIAVCRYPEPGLVFFPLVSSGPERTAPPKVQALDVSLTAAIGIDRFFHRCRSPHPFQSRMRRYRWSVHCPGSQPIAPDGAM